VASQSAALAAVIREHAIDHVFINRAELLRFAPLLRQLAPEIRLVLMSHGNQTGDDLYEVTGIGGRRTGGWHRLTATWQMGLDLRTESWHRRHGLDAVCVMSEEERTLERWLGAGCTIVLPRRLESAPLSRSPVANRIGYVGTLDHTPNRVALEAVCRELERQARPAGLELRICGGPPPVGEGLAARFSFVHYLGRLDDNALRSEAATWSLMLNPLFWLSRGASMKLTTALGWGLPVLTTKAGARGYEWGGAAVPVCADDPRKFVQAALDLLANPTALAAAGAAAQTAVASAPNLEALAGRLRQALREIN
jgi:glycosyltransferase involved in cell wall biosynthesis